MTTEDRADTTIVMKGDLRELKELSALLEDTGINTQILRPEACRLNT